MLADTNERPDVGERYETATQASRILLEEHRTGAADVLVAAGWSPTRIGMALLRLHSEWTAAAKPERVEKQGVEAIAARLKADDLRAAATAERRWEAFTQPGAVKVRAQAEADRWFTNELRILATGLKSRATVWDQLAPWAQGRGIASEVVAAALLHWLHPICPHCEGHGLRKVPNAPALSARQCSKCQGTGNKPAPDGSGRVLVHLDYCVGLARGSLSKRLSGAR